MRNLFLMASLLICLTSVNVFAQETTPAQKPANETEQPKNAVDRALDEAKEKGETVLGTCLMDCRRDPNSEEADTNRVLELPKPEYPPLARAAHVQGTVGVQVVIGFDGSVIAAVAVSGHPLLQAAAVGAARQARFTPPKFKGAPAKVVGVLQYHFIPQ